MFSQFLQFDVGGGSREKFGHDVCCGDCPLKVAFLELFSITRHKESMIYDVHQLSIRMFIFLDWSKIGSWSL